MPWLEHVLEGDQDNAGKGQKGREAISVDILSKMRKFWQRDSTRDSELRPCGSCSQGSSQYHLSRVAMMRLINLSFQDVSVHG